MELNWEKKHFAGDCSLLQILTPMGLHPYTTAWAGADPAQVQGSLGVCHSHNHGHSAQGTGTSQLVIRDDDRGKENIKHLCLICVPVCEVTIMLFDNLALVKYNLNIC